MVLSKEMQQNVLPELLASLPMPSLLSSAVRSRPLLCDAVVEEQTADAVESYFFDSISEEFDDIIDVMDGLYGSDGWVQAYVYEAGPDMIRKNDAKITWITHFFVSPEHVHSPAQSREHIRTNSDWTLTKGTPLMVWNERYVSK